MPVPYKFVFPVLRVFPASVSAKLFPLLNQSEEKKTSQNSWDFGIFKEYLSALEDSPVKRFLLEVASIQDGPFREEQAVRTGHKALFKEDKSISALLNIILAARYNAIKMLYAHPPTTREEASSYLSETQKRIQFMARIERILRPKIQHSAIAQEHCQFLVAFFEDVEANATSMEHWDSFSELTRSSFKQNQIDLEIVLTSVIERAKQTNIKEKGQLFTMIEFAMKHLKRAMGVQNSFKQHQVAIQLAAKNSEIALLSKKNAMLAAQVYSLEQQLSSLEQTVQYLISHPLPPVDFKDLLEYLPPITFTPVVNLVPNLPGVPNLGVPAPGHPPYRSR